ncbi:hypothetical protein BDN67DRAFT_1039871 [Paxillus ammoniavirescens]|nr:hypothetical protein BDN67DRAFT_1039871 [Paxillus ammoniavirescens]
MEYIVSLRNASLEDVVSKLDGAALQRIRNPPQATLQIDDSDIQHSIGTYLALEHSSQDAYEHVCHSHAINYPDCHGMLSFSEYTGVEKIQNDMCPKTCLAYTGPYEPLKSCPTCTIKIAAHKFMTIMLVSQLQAQFHHPQSTREIETGEIPVVDDVVMGWDFLGAVPDGDIKPDDIVVMVSLNGAQLYQSKESDCWIYIWVLLNMSPNKRHKKINVIPGGFIPGPNKPKNVDSFLFPGLHHVSALQTEGLTIWDASHRDDPARETVFRSDIYLLYKTADGPGLVYWDGMVGHCGKNGRHMYCGVRDRRKTDQNHYSAALLKPKDHTLHKQSMSPSIFPKCSTIQNINKRATGLTKPPLILGLLPSCSLGIPFSVTPDIMYLVANLTDLMLSLWRGTIKCDHMDNKNTWDWAVFHNGDLWDEHGELVASAGHHLPGSFDCKPRNIAEKINMQYKTWEYQLYMYGIAPALLYNTLPRKYWQNLCKVVRGMQLMCQHHLPSQQVQEVHMLLCSWEREFEKLYYQQREDYLHFVRPCAHQTLRKGPPICYAQRELTGPPKLPTNSPLVENLGDGYALLHMQQKRPSNPVGPNAAAINRFLGLAQNLEHPIQKWA